MLSKIRNGSASFKDIFTPLYACYNYQISWKALTPYQNRILTIAFKTLSILAVTGALFQFVVRPLYRYVIQWISNPAEEKITSSTKDEQLTFSFWDGEQKTVTINLSSYTNEQLLSFFLSKDSADQIQTDTPLPTKETTRVGCACTNPHTETAPCKALQRIQYIIRTAFQDSRTKEYAGLLQANSPSDQLPIKCLKILGNGAMEKNGTLIFLDLSEKENPHSIKLVIDSVNKDGWSVVKLLQQKATKSLLDKIQVQNPTFKTEGYIAYKHASEALKVRSYLLCVAKPMEFEVCVNKPQLKMNMQVGMRFSQEEVVTLKREVDDNEFTVTVSSGSDKKRLLWILDQQKEAFAKVPFSSAWTIIERSSQ